MLQVIRDKTSGLIAITIVALLIVTFAFWGVSYYFNQGGEIIAVSVNDTNIDLREYQRVYQSVRRQWQAFLKEEAARVDDEMIKKQTLDNIIDSELVKQMSDSLGLRVDAQQVRNVINSLQAFHGENGFDNTIYERSISQLGFTPLMFERKLRQDMTSEQLQSALSESVFVTDNEVKLIANLKNQTRDISYTIFSSDKLKENLIVRDEEIATFYKQHGRDYLDPDSVKIAYLDLSLQKIANQLEISEDALAEYYQANKADYDVEDQRKVWHITIATGENASDKQIELATARAEELIANLKGGMSFDVLSDKHRDDSGPKFEISELGFLTKGIMDPKIDEIMFSLAEGEISAPIVTKKSVDVIKLEKIKGGAKNTFENAREAVEQAYRLSIAEEQYFEAIDQLANLSFEHPDTLDIAAEELGLEIRESDYFNRNSKDDPLLSDSRIISASFSDDVLNGNNSDVIEIGNNRVLVLRMLEHIPEQMKSLDEVRERIVTRIKYERAGTQVRETGEAALGKLKNGSSQEQVAAEYAFAWTHSTGIKRDDPEINRSVLRTAFKLGRPEAGQAVYGGTSLGSGDYALVSVSGITDPDVSSYTEEELGQIRTQLQKLKAAGIWAQLMRDERRLSQINIYADRL